MNYQWDLKKAKTNLKKHGIGFADAVSVFLDEHAMTIDDDSFYEKRHVTIGMDAFSRLIVVVYTWRDDEIRIISARKATKKEHKHYMEKS
jgi:uncharacterized DUF497 family protein